MNEVILVLRIKIGWLIDFGKNALQAGVDGDKKTRSYLYTIHSRGTSTYAALDSTSHLRKYTFMAISETFLLAFKKTDPSLYGVSGNFIVVIFSRAAVNLLQN